MTKQSRERTKMSAILLSLKKQTSDFKSKIKNIKYVECLRTAGLPRYLRYLAMMEKGDGLPCRFCRIAMTKKDM
jgi:hypothetical protein